MSFDNRMKLSKRPMIKVGSQFQQDHGIFDPNAVVETPHRMRRAVELELPVESTSLKVGRKHIETKQDEPDSKGFSGSLYDPSKSDRFQATMRQSAHGNVITGEGCEEDSFQSRVGKATVHQPTGNFLQHNPEESSPYVSRSRHENHVKQSRSYCPWAVDDHHVEPEQPYKPLHPSNIDHGDVLSGGKMEPKYAGRRQ
eukprot:TRINITY_DN27975_c0_g1_i1.p1 TRINITY_DN27975_c0_g1~~TRINITY_DN27975_c0_g1_i1.p1  ORF type:complete len:198 (+),score=26.33 TRINITY_DN27975_c0_g1_i1:55-648(+)